MLRTTGEHLAAEAILLTGEHEGHALTAAQVEGVITALSRRGLLRDVPLPGQGQLQWEREIELRDLTGRTADELAKWVVKVEGYAREDRSNTRWTGRPARTYTQLDAALAAWLGKAAMLYLRGEA